MHRKVTVNGPFSKDLSARSVRVRILSTMLAFMAGGLLIAGFVSYYVQFTVLEDRVNTELLQEVDEFQRIAELRQSDVGDEESTEDLMRAAIQSAVPGEHEAFLAFLDDKPQFKPQEQAFELGNPETIEQILAAHEPGQTIFTEVMVDGEAVPAAIASVELYSDETPGIFVAANKIQSQREQIWISAITYTVVSLATLLASALVGLVVTGKLMRPIGDLRDATREITIYDLERRVPDPGTRDDVAALAQNFNRMLERIQEGYAHQRQFMSDVSHELRTPLTIVRGTLETTDPEDPADVTEGHEIALDELDRMNSLVTDLSTLAKTGRPDFVKFKDVNMAEFARNAFSRIEHLGPREWLLDSGTDVVAQADEDRLTQAVVQLAANAVRYSEPDTKIELKVQHMTLSGQSMIMVGVRDEGIGIAGADQARIFERFARVSESGGESGSGLGLAIVKAIAEAHGGSVSLTSRPGHGSTFTMIFPQDNTHVTDPKER